MTETASASWTCSINVESTLVVGLATDGGGGAFSSEDMLESGGDRGQWTNVLDGSRNNKRTVHTTTSCDEVTR